MAAARTFLQATGSDLDASAYTFSSQNLGTASSDRYIVVCFGGRASGATTALPVTVSVQGISATVVASIEHAATNLGCSGIAIAAVPTGTTGDVVVTYNRSMLRSCISVYSLTGISSATPTATDTDSNNDPSSLSGNVDADGVAIAVCAHATTPLADEFTWTGVTEDVETKPPTEGAWALSTASGEFGSAQTPLAVSCDTFQSIQNVTACFASWGPSAGGGLSIPVAFNHYQKLRRA